MIVGWSQDEQRVIDAVEDYLENCAQVIVENDLVENLLRPENLEVSLKVRLEARNLQGAATFSSSSTHQNSRITFWQAEDDGWKVREVTMRSRRMGETSGTYQGAKAKAPPCPNSTLQTSSSAREEEYHWEVMEERRRRRIAFEYLAKGMLRYLDNCNEVKVGITELQERVRGACAKRYFHSASGTAGHERRWPKYFRSILARRKRNMSC